MSDNKDDYIQKNLEQALEVCGDSEFLQKQRSEHFSAESEKTPTAHQNFPQITQKSVVMDCRPINQNQLVSNVLLSYDQEMWLGQIQQKTTILNACSNYESARKKFNKIFFENGLLQAVQTARTAMQGEPIREIKISPMSQIMPIDNPLFTSIYEFSSALSAGNGFSPEANMLAVITASGQASQGRYFTEESGWYEKGVLNTVFIDESGSKKSFFFELFENPFKIFEDDKKREYALIGPELSTRKKLAKLAENKLYSKAANEIYKSQLANNENTEDIMHNWIRCINAHANKSMFAEPRIFVGTGTAIKIAKELMLQGESLVSISAEGGFIKQVCKWKGKDLDLFLTSFTGERWSHETDKYGLIHLNNHSLSILANTQPKIIEEFLKNDDFMERGGMARLIIYNTDAVDFKGYRDWNNEKFLEAKATYEKKICSLLSKHYTQDQHRKLFKISIDSDAIKELNDFESIILNFIDSRENLPIQLISFYRKLHGTALRITILLHIWIYNDPCDHSINIDAVKCGIYIARWLSMHATLATQRQEINMNMERIKKVTQCLRDLFKNGHQEPYITVRKVQQKCRAVKHSASMTTDCLRFLAQCNYCREVGMTEKGSPVFALHPDIHSGQNLF